MARSLFICPVSQIHGPAALFLCRTTESSLSQFRFRRHCAIFVLSVRDPRTLKAWGTRPKPRNKPSIGRLSVSTPALNAVTLASGSNAPVLGYTVPYTLANVLLTLAGPVVVLLR